MTKAAELRELSPNDLATRLEETRRELFNLRFQIATMKLENPMRVRQVKKDIARVHTILTERAQGIR